MAILDIFSPFSQTYTIQGTSKDIGILPRTFHLLFSSFQDKIYKRTNLKPKVFSDIIKLGSAQESKEESKKKALLGLFNRTVCISLWVIKNTIEFFLNSFGAVKISASNSAPHRCLQCSCLSVLTIKTPVTNDFFGFVIVCNVTGVLFWHSCALRYFQFDDVT